MGKTPKENHGNERRRPYNYPRNAQARTQNSGTESRNYSYPSGNVPRRLPVYNLQYQGIPVPNQPYRIGAGSGYRGRLGGINKPKPISGKQRRPNKRSNRVVPLRKSAQTIMQSQTEAQESVQEETTCQKEGATAATSTTEQIIKNGPENCSSHEDPKEVGVGKIENGNPEVADRNSDCNESNGMNDNKSAATEEDAEKMKTKSKSPNVKEKKVKKSGTPTKISPKGKQSPKSKKETKPEVEEEEEEDKEKVEAENKEKERLQNKKLELELRSRESTPNSELQPSVTIVRLTSPQAETSEINDSVVEIPNQDKSCEIVLPTSAEESSSKLLETRSVKDSPRRSTRLATHLPLPKPRSAAKPDSSSIIVLDSDDSISILEISRTSQDKSFGQSLRSLSGRPSLRSVPVHSRSFNRLSTVGSASIRSNISSRSGTTTGNDSESDSQETKILQSKSGLWGLFRSPSRNAQSQDSATDNEESTNRSIADDSGNDSEATTEPLPEAPSSLGFRKRKIRDADLKDDSEQENKRIRGEQKTNANSPGILSIMSSPMNLFASKIRGEKGKSSTPVQMLRASIMDEETREDLSVHQDVGEIQYDDENPNNMIEKESLATVSAKMDEEQGVAPRRWCNIM